MSNDIVVVGSCMIDFISYTDNLPKAGETIHGHKFVTGFGGKGANQCVAAAKLGGKTTFVARLGDDHWGKDYEQRLKGERVDTSFIRLTPGETSGIAQIAVDKSGENQIVIVAGANHKLCPEDVMGAKEVLQKAKVLLLQLETPTDAAMKAIELCGGISILNGAPAIKHAPCGLLRAPTIFCVNESEASVFTGLPVNDNNQAKTAVDALLKKGCKSVLLTLGPAGALYASKEKPEPILIPAQKMTAVDTTGAGDCFLGAFAYMLAERSDLPIEKNIEVACRVAGISVTIPGTQTSYPDNSELQKILKEMNL